MNHMQPDALPPNGNGESVYSWINPKLTIAKSSINGNGYSTRAVIEKDEILIVQSGRILHVHEADHELDKPYACHGFQVEKEIYIFPFLENKEPHLEGIFMVNHSCEPNAGFRGQITLISMRTINIGEEITYDYAMTDVEHEDEIPWKEGQCECGSENCRGRITGSDWKLPYLHKKYHGYFSQHVENSIANLTENS